MSACCCFWWVPYDLRAKFDSDDPESIADELHFVAERMKKAFLKEGSLMISFYHIGDNKPAFWRIPNINPEISHDHMWSILRIINRVGNDCFPPSVGLKEIEEQMSRKRLSSMNCSPTRISTFR